jgi:hypothetical protein
MRITYLTPKVIQGGILTADSRQAYPTAVGGRHAGHL